jgi:hypothetical protein
LLPVLKVRGKEETNEHAKTGASREVREGVSFASHDSMRGETRQRRHDLLVAQSPSRERIVSLEAGQHAEYFGDGGVRSGPAFAVRGASGTVRLTEPLRVQQGGP